MNSLLSSVLVSLLMLLSVKVADAFTEKIATAEDVVLLRRGGYVLYMRHGATNTSKPDRVPNVDLNDCSTQRPLTKEGRKMAADVGRNIKKAGIPVAIVIASPLCRARESAVAAFGMEITVDSDLMYTANMTSEEKKPNMEATRRLLSAPVAMGSNRIIVAHAPNLADLIGYFPKEGTVVIFRPKGKDGFDYIASIPPEYWHHLLAR